MTDFKEFVDLYCPSYEMVEKYYQQITIQLNKNNNQAL